MLEIASKFKKGEEVVENTDFLTKSISLMIEFVSHLKVTKEEFTLKEVEKIDEQLNMSQFSHPEIKCDWLSISTGKGLESSVKPTQEMATSIG
jgi:ATP-dependent RNA circularization protein (DNA/RNA ligase family)